MGTPQTPPPVKLIVGVLAAAAPLLTAAAARLQERFGPIDSRSEPCAWGFSHYYRDEMGPSLVRQFVTFERLLAPGKLAGIKQLTNEMEGEWRTESGRRVNLDPGYVAATKLVLATTKDAGHRVYLSGGIHAEVTLQFIDGSFQPLFHTYPDYAAVEALTFFSRVRSHYLAQLRGLH